MKKRLLIVLLCMLLAVSACGKTEIRPAADESKSEEAAQALSFETTDLNGDAVSNDHFTLNPNRFFWHPARASTAPSSSRLYTT